LAGRISLFALQRLGLRGRYVKRLDAMKDLVYWTGVAEAAGGAQAWTDVFRRAARAAGEATIDLATTTWPPSFGLTTAGAVVTYNEKELARIPLRLGGVPFDPDVFAAKIVDRSAGGALRARVSR
jgi:hypothetical protein